VVISKERKKENVFSQIKRIYLILLLKKTTTRKKTKNLRRKIRFL